MDLVNEAITWLQNGEPVTGGSGGNSDGVMNRPLVELLANDNGLQDRVDIVADDDGYIKKAISSLKITETDAATTARVQIDATGLKAYDGSANKIIDIDEAGNITMGYGSNDQITLASGVLSGKFNSILLTSASGTGIEVTAAAEYGLKLGNCTAGDHGPLNIANAGVTGAAALHSTAYPDAEVDTLAIDDNHDLYIKSGASTWTRIGGTIISPVSSANIGSPLSQASSVILDSNGLTQRNAASAVRFIVREDGSWTLGNTGADYIDFSSDTDMTINNATITGCFIDGDTNTLSNLAHGFEVDNPTIAHGATGAVVGTTNDQTLTNKHISGEQIDSGTVAAARIASLDTAKITTGTFDTARIPNLSANKITSDVLAIARIPDISGKNITLAGSTPDKIIFDGSSWDTELYGDSTGSKVYLLPDTTKAVDFEIGSNTYLFDNITLRGQDTQIIANNTGTSSASARINCAGTSGNVTFECIDSAGTSTEQYFFTPDSGFYPNVGHPDLGGSGAEWGDFWVQAIYTDYMSVSTQAGQSISLTLTGSAPTQAMLKVDPSGSAPTQTTGQGGIWWDSNCDQYIQITSASGNNWRRFAREDSSIRAGYTLGFIGSDSSPAEIRFTGSGSRYSRMYCDTAADDMFIKPDTTDLIILNIGTDADRWSICNIYAQAVRTHSQTDASIYVNDGVVMGLDVDNADSIHPVSTGETMDCGTSAQGWDVVYRVSEAAPAEMYFMDGRKDLNTGKVNKIDDLEILNSIKPRMDKKGKPVFDKKTGYMLTDDTTLPEWLFVRSKRDGTIEKNKKGQPFYNIDAMTQLCAGGIRSLYSKFKESLKTIEALTKRLEALELN